MSDLNRFIRETNLFIDRSLNFLEIPSVRMVIIIVLIIYTTALIPKLTNELNSIMNNVFVKILMLLVIVYLGSKDPVLALLVGIAFVMSLLQTTYGKFSSPILDPPVVNSTAGQENNYPVQQNNPAQPTVMNNTQCQQQCATNGTMGDGNLQNRCTPVAAFSNEMNAQGLNCPMGSSGPLIGGIF